MGLDGEEDEVDLADLLVVVSRGGPGLEIALRTPYADASRLHGPQVPTARYQENIVAGQAEPGAQVGPDGPGPDHREPHAEDPPVMISATIRRCTLPVAVLGMASTM